VRPIGWRAELGDCLLARVVMESFAENGVGVCQDPSEVVTDPAIGCAGWPNATAPSPPSTRSTCPGNTRCSTHRWCTCADIPGYAQAT